jgi:hypothetical protein
MLHSYITMHGAKILGIKDFIQCYTGKEIVPFNVSKFPTSSNKGIIRNRLILLTFVFQYGNKDKHIGLTLNTRIYLLML